MCVYMCMCACVQRLDVNISVFSLTLPTFLRQRLLWNLRLTSLAKLTGQQIAGTLLCLPLQDEDYRHELAHPIDVCLFVSYVNMCVGTCREQKKVSDPLKLE